MFVIKGSSCKTYSISIMQGRGPSKIISWAMVHRLRNPVLNEAYTGWQLRLYCNRANAKHKFFGKEQV